MCVLGCREYQIAIGVVLDGGDGALVSLKQDGLELRVYLRVRDAAVARHRRLVHCANSTYSDEDVCLSILFLLGFYRYLPAVRFTYCEWRGWGVAGAEMKPMSLLIDS